ncbi:uncharacterized protein TNCV_3554321 [Trichonephila clavipes]|nr:uncharacterized protein TNCV_3554321 [Trichonephila clavipes]
MDHVILNHGQATWMTPELAPPLLTATPHQREDVSALDRLTCIAAVHDGSLVTVLEEKREEYVDDALIYAKSLREEFEISFESPRRIKRKHIFGDGSKDVQLSYEDGLRRTMLSSIDRITLLKFQKDSNSYRM